MVSLRATMLKTALGFLANLEALPQGNENFVRGRTPDALHALVPASLGLAPLDNAAEVANLDNLFPGLEFFNVQTIGENPFIIDVETKRIVVHANVTAQTAVGSYTNEFIFTITTTDDGKLVKYSKEFVDSVLSLEYLEKLENGGQ
jgi:hypothetical protein